MKNRALTALLIASLAVNLALFITLLRKPQRFTRPVKENTVMQLQADQQNQLQDIIQEFKIEALLLKDEVLNTRIEIIEEIANPEYDLNQVRLLVTELNEIENRLNELYVNAIISIGEILDPEQRLMLLYRLSMDWYNLSGPLPGRNQ